MLAMKIMSALSQPIRYETFRKLVAKLPEGMAAGDIAVAVGSGANNMSAHLAILQRAGLVSSEKSGRSIVYRAETEPVEELSDFLALACEQGKAARRSG